MQRYVAGFLFREDQTEVALVRKKTPEWQAGKLNGIGGKVEPGETEYAAMVREFKEETGLPILGWSPVAVLTIGDAEVHFFRSSDWPYGDRVLNPINDVGESIEWVSVLWLQCRAGQSEAISNLRWLIPMAADRDLPFGEIKSGFSGK